MMRGGVTSQSPAAYDRQNLQALMLAARMADAASASMREYLRTAQQDSGYRFIIHPAETAAGLLDADLRFGYDVGDVARYKQGVDDRTAINRAFAVAVAAAGPFVLNLWNDTYDLGAGMGTYAQIELGEPTSGGDGAQDVTVMGAGAVINQGAAGKAWGIFNARKVTIKGVRVVGYTGGTLGASRENDACITVNYSSHDVTLDGVYLTNSLGDCVYAGGTLTAGGGTGEETRNLTIKNSVLKERYGDGVASLSGGTRSRLAVALIDVIGVKIHANTIIGGIDLEPNLNGQHLVGVQIYDNNFRSGHVTAQAVIGTDYNHDEPINASGGSVIRGEVYITGVAASPVVEGNVCRDNTFEYGYITQANVYVFEEITGNTFVAGQIESGSTSGANDTANTIIKDNTTLAPMSGETLFIKLSGYHTLSLFEDNACKIASGYCIGTNGASTGDNGRCSFINNRNLSSTGAGGVNVTLSSTSLQVGSVGMQSAIAWPYANQSKLQSLWIEQVPVAIAAGTNLVIDWRTYKGNKWYVTQTSGVGTSIAQITDVPGDGYELTIFADASGGGTLTLLHNTSYLRLKGAANAVMLTGYVITLYSRAGIWWERTRSW